MATDAVMFIARCGCTRGGTWLRVSLELSNLPALGRTYEAGVGTGGDGSDLSHLGWRSLCWRIRGRERRGASGL